MSQKVTCRLASSQPMLGDQDFMQMLKFWASILKLDSMNMERLLATVKASAGSSSKRHAPHAERLLAAGFLTQLRQEHRTVAPADAGIVTRKRLLESEAPLRCAKKPKLAKACDSGGGYVMFRKKGVRGQSEDE